MIKLATCTISREPFKTVWRMRSSTVPSRRNRFVQRRAELKMRFSHAYDFQRALCEDPNALNAWFRLVANIKDKYKPPLITEKSVLRPLTARDPERVGGVIELPEPVWFAGRGVNSVSVFEPVFEPVFGPIFKQVFEPVFEPVLESVFDLYPVQIRFANRGGFLNDFTITRVIWSCRLSTSVTHLYKRLRDRYLSCYRIGYTGDPTV